MNRIIGYPLYVDPGTEMITIPPTTQFLSVTNGRACIKLWALVPEVGEASERFEVLKVAEQGLVDGFWSYVGVTDTAHRYAIHVFVRRVT